MSRPSLLAPPFSEVGIEVDDVLETIIAGGNLIAERHGSKKRRRVVPAKQRKLVRLVAAEGTVAFKQLKNAYAAEWLRIEQRRKGQPRVALKREFTRNLSDLVRRINSALDAVHRSCKEGHALSVRALSMDQGTGVLWWIPCERAEQPEEPLDTSLTSRSSAGAQQGTGTQGLSADLSDRKQQVDEDPVTGVLSFRLDGRLVELMPGSELVSVDGRVVSLRAVETLNASDPGLAQVIQDIWKRCKG